MKKKSILIAAGAFAAAAAGVCLTFPIHTRPVNSSGQLSALTSSFFENEVCASTLNLHYTLADPAAYGIDDYPVTLSSFSSDSLTSSQVLTENYLASLRAIDRSALTEEEQLTYDVLFYTLDLSLEGFPWYYYQEPLSPTLGVQAQLPILLAEYAFYSEKDVAEYLTLLSQTEDYFTSILDFEEEKADRDLFMSDEVADEIISQCIDFIDDAEDSYLEELFVEKVNGLSGLSEEKKADYIRQNEALLETSVQPAYEELVNGLSALKGSGVNDCGLCYFPKGTSYYEYLVKASVGTDKPPEQLQELLSQKRNQYSMEIQEIVSENPSLLASMDISLDTDAPDYILNTLKQEISEDFPSLPRTSFTVKDVHPSLQTYSSPAFYLTPPIDRMTDNVIYINPANGYRGIELFTTLAHEGYPGHLYQTVYSHAYCPNPLQSILNIGGYTEGWATYAEFYSYSLAGLMPDTARLLMLNKAWTLNLYCAIDLGIHYYGWTRYDVYEFLNGYGIDDPEVSDRIFTAIVEDPANYLKYYVGYLEFDALRERAANALGGNFSLQDFHRYLLTLGPASFSLLEKQVDAYIARQD